MKILGKDDEEAHCCRIEESSIINIILTCDISTYSSSYIVNCADKYKLQITNKEGYKVKAYYATKNAF